MQDARATVQHMIAITKRAEELGCTHIELCVADELSLQVKPLVSGIFRFKTFWKAVRTQSDNIFYALPQYVNLRTLPQPVSVKPAMEDVTAPAPKRRGRPPKNPDSIAA